MTSDPHTPRAPRTPDTPPVQPHAGVTDADRAMMGRALELARTAATLGEIPVGVVVYETATGRVLGEAHNRRHLDKDPAAHAELLAIRLAAEALGDWRLNACSLAVTFEPCCMCAGLIVNARIGRVIYGCDDPKAGGAGSLYRLTEDARLNHRVTPIRGVMADESAELLRSFFRVRRGGGPSLMEE